MVAANVASMAYADTDTHKSKTGKRDPSGGERLQVFCRACLGAVDGGGEVYRAGRVWPISHCGRCMGQHGTAWDSICLSAAASGQGLSSKAGA
jgi:hypothetical protein